MTVDAKKWSTIQARAALMGIAVACCEDDHGREVFVVTRVDWALTRTLDSLDELQAFLERAQGLRLVTRREAPP